MHAGFIFVVKNESRRIVPRCVVGQANDRLVCLPPVGNGFPFLDTPRPFPVAPAGIPVRPPALRTPLAPKLSISSGSVKTLLAREEDTRCAIACLHDTPSPTRGASRTKAARRRQVQPPEGSVRKQVWTSAHAAISAPLAEARGRSARGRLRSGRSPGQDSAPPPGWQ